MPHLGPRVLVTGARGFVGRALSEGFAELGWSVIGLDRAVDDATGTAGPEDVARPANGIRWVAADLADAMPDEVPEVDLVVHAAWVTTDPETLGVSAADAEALRGGENFIATEIHSAASDQTVLKAFDGLRVADVTDGMDAVGLFNTGLMDPEIAPLWKDARDYKHRFIGIAVTARQAASNAGAVVSKVVHRGDGLDVTVFGFDAGEQLTEHQAARAAMVQVLSGRLRFTVDGVPIELGPGSWLHMSAGAPHALVATEPTVMLLTLIGS